MPSLKELKTRIDSVKNTRKITRAMQMVAAAKLRRAQEAAEAARPYSERMASVIGNLASSMAGSADAPALLRGTGEDQVHLLVVATADRGLCGAFNTNIVRLAREHLEKLQNEGKTVKLFLVGKKGYDAMKRAHGGSIVEHLDLGNPKRVEFAQAQPIGSKILELFEAGEFDVCTLFYSEFKSVISQVPTAQQLIPVPIPEAGEGPDFGGAIYDYEPDEKAILEDLLPRNVTAQVFRAMLENAASEQGSRMSAMDNATRNAGEMIDDLTLLFNRTRQAQITKELIEIISGAEAL
jgi:F-type H+-transporting ATPase subunit gamma